MIAKNHCLMKLRDKGRFNAEINERSMTTMNLKKKISILKKTRPSATWQALYFASTKNSNYV